MVFKHENDTVAVVPRHGNEEIGRGLLRKIAEEIGISSEDFARLLERS
jgi:predicted RNA binding protein YcfA (HicA-like mRNA interferase family)